MAIELFKYEPAPPAPWRAGDVLLIILIYFGAQFFMAGLLLSDDPPPPPAVPQPKLAGVVLRWVEPSPTIYLNMKLMAGMAVVNLLVVAAAIAYLRGVRGASWGDLGLRLDHAQRDVLRGVTMFAIVVIPIYMLHGLVSLIFGPETHHPIINAVTKYPGFFGLCFVSAVLIAPLSEEFLFRGVLQGWLESLPTARYESPVTPARLAFWPVTLTSLLFALLHLGHGAAPIALFFFSLALGWLYQRTHRLLPSVVLHTCLNALSMLMLLVPTP